MSTAPKSDVSPFLEAIRQQQQKANAPNIGSAPQLDAPMVLLNILAQRGPQPVQELYPASGMDFSQFSQALSGLQEATLVELTKRNGAEVVELTPAGAKLASLSSRRS